MPSILIVEDHDQVRGLLADWFTAAGYAVQAAKGSQHAIEQFRRSPAEVVLLDVNLPSGEGLETIRQLRTQFPSSTARVILMFGCGVQFGPDDIEETGLVAGAHATVCKPFDRMHLLRVVMEQRQLARYTCSKTYYIPSRVVHQC